MLKKTVTWVLLIFVLTSVITALAKEVKPGEGSEMLARETAEKAVVVTYFHSNVRCKSCTQIEKWTKSTIAEEYTEEIMDGDVIWRMINTDEKGNEHYIDDYFLYTKHVILAEFVDGKQIRWKNLDQLWPMLKEGEEEFKEYIHHETQRFIDGEEDEDVIFVKEKDGE